MEKTQDYRRSLIEVAGSECRPFLQRLVTCDVTALTPAQGLWGAILTPQGRLRHSFIVSCPDDSSQTVYLDCSQQHAQTLILILTKYRLRAQLDISLTSYSVRIADGPYTEPSSESSRELLYEIPDPRHHSLGWRSYLRTDVSTQQQSAWHAKRYDLGLLDCCEIPPDNYLPLDLGLDAFGGIAWNKGCYIGQEVTARIHHRSLLKRHVFPISFTTSSPPELEIGGQLFHEQKPIGIIIARQGNKGIAIASLAFLKGHDLPLIGNGFTILAPRAPISDYLAKQLSAS